MPLRLGAIVLKAGDVERASRFWQQTLGYVPHPRNAAFLSAGDGSSVELHLDDEDATHLDLWTLEADDLPAEVQRLLDAGAQRVDWDYPADADFVVLSDPDGNHFCVVAVSADRGPG